MTHEHDISEDIEPISKSKHQILEELEVMDSEHEKVILLKNLIKYGDHSTKEHAWDALDNLYESGAVKDSSGTSVDGLMMTKKYREGFDFTK